MEGMNLKKLFFSFFILLILAPTLSAQNTLKPPPVEWFPPIGIPEPSFGIRETHFMYQLDTGQNCSNTPIKCFDFGSGLQPYRDNGAGPYTHYVDSSATASCTTTGFGTPTAPLCYVPRNLLPGSVVEIHGVYNRETVIASRGSAAQPIFIRGTSPNTKTKVIASLTAEGDSYVIFENLDIADADGDLVGGNRGYFGISDRNRTRMDSDHVVLRNSNVHGNLEGGGTGIAAYGESILSNCVFYNNKIFQNGDVNANFDQDNHGIGVGLGAQYLWVVDNEMYKNSGDGIQINTMPGVNVAHHIYVGRNVSYSNKQSGFWTKYAHDVIFSQNIAYDHRPSNSSAGAGMGYQYGPDRVWFIFNRIYNNSIGIMMGSRSGPGFDGDGISSYFVGNVIYNIHPNAGQPYDPVSSYSPAAIASWGGQSRYVVNNTIYDVEAGINCPDNNPWYFSNNIISNVTNAQSNHIYLQSAGTWTLNNNLLFQPGGNERVKEFNTVYRVADVQRPPLSKGLNNLNVDPKFLNIAAADFSLQSTSPAKDAGTFSTVYDTFQSLYGLNIRRDFLGNVRPADNTWDIGAYEYGATGGPSIPRSPSGLRTVP
jgi:hypothetical protein